MFSEALENLIQASLEDGILTDQEKKVIIKRAEKEGVDIDELEIYIQSLLQKRQRLDAEKRSEYDRQKKMGMVKKCPNCGTEILGGSAVCTECGYAFNNVQSNSSSEKLLNKLEEINKDQEKQINNMSFSVFNTVKAGQQVGHIAKSKMTIISGFPVPNTRADLLEFLTMLEPKVNAVGPKDGMGFGNEEDLSYAYWLLFCNCINKAKISFANDKDFIPFFKKQEEELKKTNGLLGQWRKASKIKKFLIGYLLIFILLLISLAKCKSPSFSPSSFEPSGNAQEDLQEIVEYFSDNVRRASSVQEIGAIQYELANFLDSKVISNYCNEHPDYKTKFDEYRDVVLGQLEKDVIKRTQELEKSEAEKTSSEDSEINDSEESENVSL